jgi:hypothetical protein
VRGRVTAKKVCRPAFPARLRCPEKYALKRYLARARKISARQQAQKRHSATSAREGRRQPSGPSSVEFPRRRLR